jgi:membrane-bound serine protease (ClpP class)
VNILFLGCLEDFAMNFLLDPNVAYVLLMVGMVMAIFALFSPGTGLLEAGALILLLITGYSIYKLPINLWALIVLLVGVFPFILALRRARHWIFLLISLAALITGSIFLFRTESGGAAVNPVLASVVSILATTMLWLISSQVLTAYFQKPSHDLGRLIGAIGETRSELEADREGTVYVMGEDWTARSDVPIAAGARVEVVNREGLILTVKPFTSK